jgi:hypothetical protein
MSHDSWPSTTTTIPGTSDGNLTVGSFLRNPPLLCDCCVRPSDSPLLAVAKVDAVLAVRHTHDETTAQSLAQATQRSARHTEGGFGAST